MSKLLIKLSSHGFSDFEQCPQKFEYSSVQRIAKRKKADFFSRGTVIDECLTDWYNARIAKNTDRAALILEIVEKRITASSLSEDDKGLCETAFYKYVKHYKEELIWPIACALPFSKKLYEDDTKIVLYEGTVDFLCEDLRDQRKQVWDHKTYSRWSPYYWYNNQLIGYCWAMGVKTFVYNYIGFLKQPASECLKRTPIIVSADVTSAWVADKIKTAHRIEHAYRTGDFYKTMQCSGKFGVCTFSRLCETPSPQARAQLINIEYEPSDYGSWDDLAEVEEV